MELKIDREFHNEWHAKFRTADQATRAQMHRELEKVCVPGRVGYGDKVHNLVIDHVGGKVIFVSCWCGSQKFNGFSTSPLTILPEGTEITCKKCRPGK